MTMVQGTTPTIELDIEGWDLTGCRAEAVFKRKARTVVISGDRLTIAADEDGSSILLKLTQEETLHLKEGACEVQVRWIDENGDAAATWPIETLHIGQLLRLRPITYTEEEIENG